MKNASNTRLVSVLRWKSNMCACLRTEFTTGRPNPCLQRGACYWEAKAGLAVVYRTTIKTIECWLGRIAEGKNVVGAGFVTIDALAFLAAEGKCK